MDEGIEDVTPIPRLLRGARGCYSFNIQQHLHRVDCHDLPKGGPFVVGGLESGVSAGQLFREMGLSDSRRERLLSSLLQSGFVEPGRGVPAYAVPDLVNTERGTVAAGAVNEAIQEVNRELQERLEPADMKGFVAGLAALCRIKEEHEERAQRRS